MPVFTLLGLAVFFIGMAVGFGLAAGEDDEAVTVTVAEQGENAAGRGSQPPATPARATVAAVVDGDTIRLQDGRRIRLLQIDAPEVGEGECYSRKAASVLRSMLPVGTTVQLRLDPTLDRRDRFGRLLRYVFKGKTNVNVALTRRGAASAYFFNGDRGRYAARLLNETQGAKAESRGLWQACRGTELDPERALVATSRLAPSPPPAQPPAPVTPAPPTPAPAPPSEPVPADCDQNYSGYCVPDVPYDLNCVDIGYTTVSVVGVDRHGFDGDDAGGGFPHRSRRSTVSAAAQSGALACQGVSGTTDPPSPAGP